MPAAELIIADTADFSGEHADVGGVGAADFWEEGGDNLKGEERIDFDVVEEIFFGELAEFFLWFYIVIVEKAGGDEGEIWGW